MNRTLWGLDLVFVAFGMVLAGLPQAVAYAADTMPPTGTIVINDNHSATNTPNVTLTLTWDDGVDGSGVSRMRFSDDGAHWTAWEPPVATRAYTLPPGADGYRTVRVQYLDRANNRSAVYNDFIRLDTTPPTGAVIINGGAAATTSPTVSLGLNWSDGAGVGVTRMRFSDDGAHWTAWEPPAATRAYTLPAGLGHHTVRVQYLDGAGNRSAVCDDYIKLVAPTEATVLLPGDVPLVMVWIQGGTFMMGRIPGEQDSYPSEDPQHSVTLGGFWMAKSELTKRQWTAVMNTTPWSGQLYVLADLDSPAEFVSWSDAQSFLTAVNSCTGKTFRLPSEAQWEYACRGGTPTRFYWGDDPGHTDIGNYEWYFDNCSGEQYTHVVGAKRANPFGLHDMGGNAEEWCEDDWHSNYVGAPTGGQAWVDSPRGSYRMARGGCWHYLAEGSRSAVRASHASPDDLGNALGFRVVRTP